MSRLFNISVGMMAKLISLYIGEFDLYCDFERIEQILKSIPMPKGTALSVERSWSDDPRHANRYSIRLENVSEPWEVPIPDLANGIIEAFRGIGAEAQIVLGPMSDPPD